jgi:enoyl-CoA hydratase/carnithine racemase
MQAVSQFSAKPLHQDATTYAHLVDGVGVITVRTPYLKQGNPLNEAVLDGVWQGLEAVMRAGAYGVLMTAHSPRPYTPELEELARRDDRTKPNPKATSMGANVLEIGASHDLDSPEGLSYLERLLRKGQDLSETLYGLTVPVVSAIHGYCIGGGSELFIVPADYVLARMNFSGGQPEKNLGILPGWGGHKLVHKLGRSKTEEFILTGKQVGIEEALACGYVNELVALPDELVARGIRKVKELAETGKKAKPTSITIPDLAGGMYHTAVTGIKECSCTPTCGEPAIQKAFSDIFYRTGSGGTEEVSHDELHRRERDAILSLLQQPGPRNRMLTFVNSMGRKYAPDTLRHWHKERV